MRYLQSQNPKTPKPQNPLFQEIKIYYNNLNLIDIINEFSFLFIYFQEHQVNLSQFSLIQLVPRIPA